MMTPDMFSAIAIRRYVASFSAWASELHSTTEYPASDAASSTPRAISVKYGFSMSGITRAMTSEVWVRSVRAVRFGVKRSSSAAARTAAAFSSDTLVPLKTRETVAGETPARRATS